MDRVDPGTVESAVSGTGTLRSRLSEPLGTTDVAINRYRIPPGEGLPAGLHAHLDQEEVFVVLEGTATFEVLIPTEADDADSGTTEEPDPPRETAGTRASSADPGPRRITDREARVVTVEAGEAVHFAPGEFQSGRNDGDGDLEMVALGAPPDSDAVRLPAACPACGYHELGLETGREELAFSCPDCGERRVPALCPGCGHHDLRVGLGDDGGTETVCHGCGATYSEPPLEN